MFDKRDGLENYCKILLRNWWTGCVVQSRSKVLDHLPDIRIFTIS